MGEIADMMIGGEMCEGCGVFLDDGGYGIPRYCSDECARDRGFDGIQSDGAGIYREKKKVKEHREPCLTINLTHNGRMLYDDRRKIQIKGVGYEKAQKFAQEVRQLAEKHFGDKVPAPPQEVSND